MISRKSFSIKSVYASRSSVFFFLSRGVKNWKGFLSMENSTTYNDLLSMKIPKVSYQIDPFFFLFDFFFFFFMKNFFQFRFWFINWIFSTFLFLSTLNPKKAWDREGATLPIPSFHRQNDSFLFFQKYHSNFRLFNGWSRSF